MYLEISASEFSQNFNREKRSDLNAYKKLVKTEPKGRVS